MIAEKLMKLIELDVYKPGRRIHAEADLTRRWKVARSSVRTALQRLETLGQVEARHGRGWYVKRKAPDQPLVLVESVSQHSIRDLFEMRMGYEALAVSLAAARATSTELDAITEFNLAHELAGDDRDELVRTDQAFHEAIVRASHNASLLASYLAVVAQLTTFRRDTFTDRKVAVHSAREHNRIIQRLGNHDQGGARGAMNSHLQRVYDGIAHLGDKSLDMEYSPIEGELRWGLRRD